MDGAVLDDDPTRTDEDDDDDVDTDVVFPN